MVRIDRRSGKRVFDGWPSLTEYTPATIWEAFKPDTEPRRSLDRQTLEEKRMAALAAIRAARAERRASTSNDAVAIDDTFLEDQGGIY